MLARDWPGPELLALAAAQAGTLSSTQVQEAGLGRPALRRLLRLGEWQRLDRAVYLTRGDEPSWLAWAWGGVLVAGDGARLVERSAAHLHGLVDEPPGRITILAPQGEVLRSRQRWVFRRQRPGVRDPRAFGRPPRTGVEDTVLDLCDLGDEAAAIGWVTSAVQQRRTTTARLGASLAHRGRARHRALLRDLLADVAAGAETPLELRYLRDVERPHGLPVGQRQDLRDADVRDVVYDAYSTVVELDGRLGHEGSGRFRDMARDNRATSRGEVTLRYGSTDVWTRPCQVAQQVASILRRQGWTGVLLLCPRCPSGATSGRVVS